MTSRHSATSISIRNLSINFGGQLALREINLDIPARSITVLLGFSGSGKTTFLRSLNRLNEELPGCRRDGSITLTSGNGKSVEIHDRGVELTALRRRVGMVFQHPNLLPTTIRRNITLPLTLTTALPAPEQQSRVEKSLRAVQLWEEVADRLDTPASQLSGGQQQRLCLARTLVLEPEILLLDEPTASLDFRATARIEETIAGLTQQYTVVMVSHNPSQAFRLADRIVSFRDGAVVSIHSKESFGSRETFQELVEELLPA
jgi:phosphate transport system ATP-binding protein